MATNDKAPETVPAAPAAPAPVEPPKADRKGKQLSATVSPEFYAEFNDMQWDKRKSPTDMLREAAELYVAAHKAAKSEATDAK